MLFLECLNIKEHEWSSFCDNFEVWLTINLNPFFEIYVQLQSMFCTLKRFLYELESLWHVSQNHPPHRILNSSEYIMYKFVKIQRILIKRMSLRHSHVRVTRCLYFFTFGEIDNALEKKNLRFTRNSFSVYQFWGLWNKWQESQMDV